MKLNEVTDKMLSDISEDAFKDSCVCKCVQRATQPYFSASWGNWLPGDPAEFEVEGYDEYITICVRDIANLVDDASENEVRDALNEIMSGILLTEDEYWNRAVDEYDGYVDGYGYGDAYDD